MALGQIAALYRYPVKGFSPEEIDQAELTAGAFFPCDRLFAIENGPSGFDPAAPGHISKQKFTVLARAAELARARTRFDDESGDFEIELDGVTSIFSLADMDGREQFASFLSAQFGDQFAGPLKVLEGPDGHRFTDHHSGQVSLLNLASVEAFSDALGQPVEASRFRMNVHLSGMAPWAEDDWQPGNRLKLGGAVLEVLKPTKRCKATHANPQTGIYDLNLVPELFRLFQRNTLGVYALVSEGGHIRPGDRLERA
ncbi:MOSC domain-containing protein [Ponticaulis profundi]|uniref:MOSC domain-containing protein n=1 Tax=Ponticaulis profundi TaxID=2665222 RepID=A0ABW1SBH4_9PROT